MDNDFIKKKDAKSPFLVSWLGITKPSPSIGGSLQQVDSVVKVGLGMHVGYPLQRIGNADHQLISLGDPGEGITTRPVELAEATLQKSAPLKEFLFRQLNC